MERLRNSIQPGNVITDVKLFLGGEREEQRANQASDIRGQRVNLVIATNDSKTCWVDRRERIFTSRFALCV